MNDDRYPAGYPDGVDVARALKLARALLAEWPAIPDAKGRVPGMSHFVAMALLQVTADRARLVALVGTLTEALRGVYLAAPTAHHGPSGCFCRPSAKTCVWCVVRAALEAASQETTTKGGSA